MIRYLSAVTLVVGAVAGAAPALAIDPMFPDFGNNGIDVTRYDINLDVDPVSGEIAARTTLSIRALQDLQAFTLDLHGLTVSRVIINGKAQQFRRDGDKLLIRSDRLLPADRPFQTTVDYSGVPDALPDPTAPHDALFLGWFKYGNATYVVSEPVGASTFFPANDEPTDKALFNFNITVPEGYMGVANGKFVGSTPLGAKRRFTWAMEQPMTTWLATAHVNKFNLDYSLAADATPIRVYYPDGVPEAHAKAYAKAGEMLTYMESKVGNYPFASYGTVVVQDPILYYALETQAMSTFPAEANPPGEDFVAHELAHQWFGDSISVAEWKDLWIAEGTATYFEVLWTHHDDPAGFNASMLQLYNYVAKNKIGPAVVDKPVDLFTDRTYYRGAAALYALQLKVGESTFFQILRRFAQDNRGGNVTSEKFIDTAVRISGDGSVRNLLEAWLYDKAVPALPSLAAVRMAASAPATKPKLVGSRCGRGSHRGAPAACP